MIFCIDFGIGVIFLFDYRIFLYSTGVVLTFWGVETTSLKIFKCVHIFRVKFEGKI